MNWIKTSGASFKLLRLTNFPRILQNDIRNLYYPNLNCGKQLKKNIKFPIKICFQYYSELNKYW